MTRSWVCVPLLTILLGPIGNIVLLSKLWQFEEKSYMILAMRITLCNACVPGLTWT